MNVNFPLLLVILTLVCGAVWLIDALFFARRRKRGRLEEAALGESRTSGSRAGESRASGSRTTDQQKAYDPWPVEYARSFFPVLLVVLALRSFVIEPFRIPSGSMIPTLLVGDFILVNKFAYGVRLPVVHTKIFGTGSPKRGDVAVFRFPKDPQFDYIKRVIGIPGDKIEYELSSKTLRVNGEVAPISDIGPYIDPFTDEVVNGAILRQEDLLGVSHEVLNSRSGFSPAVGAWEVPEGHYFMMGDNRDRSNDSRFWGFVPEENLVGRAFFIWLNFNDFTMLWDRIGDRIK